MKNKFRLHSDQNYFRMMTMMTMVTLKAKSTCYISTEITKNF